MMRRLATEGARDLLVRETAITTVRGTSREHDPKSQLAALFRFVRDNIMFIGDVAGVETLQSPRYTLTIKAGDCDDRATLLAALARSIGIAADMRFKAIAANPSTNSLSHVYVVARVGGRDIALDPTYHRNAPGYEFPLASRTMERTI
jgi:transglutaminase-like putative cysteine protease